MKSNIAILSALLVLAPIAAPAPVANAQYYGAYGSTWNNPMSASSDLIIQHNMERRMLKKRLARRAKARRTTRRTTRRTRFIRRTSRC